MFHWSNNSRTMNKELEKWNKGWKNEILDNFDLWTSKLC